MATKRRDIAVGKEKGISPSQTATTKLRGTPNQPKKTNVISTSSQKQIPSNLRPTSKAMATDVSKLQGKKPASTDTAHKPTNARTKPIDKTVSPTQKTHVPTNASVRSSSLSGKTVDSQKPVSGKNLKTPSKDVGKQRLLHATNVSSVKKSSTSMKKHEVGSGFSTTKEQITCIPHEKIENSSVSGVLEAETQPQDQESYIAEADEKRVQIDEKGTDDLVLEDQEPLDIEKNEAEIDHTDAKVVISESSTVLDRQDTTEEKSYIEEHSMNERNSCNKGENLADNSHEDAIDEEVKEVEEVAKEQERALSKKDEATSGSEAHECKQTEGQQVAVEKKQESENAAPKLQERAHGKKDLALSNDVIEETANKLREQRKNKVRALAGAFETVISLQEK